MKLKDIHIGAYYAYGNHYEGDYYPHPENEKVTVLEIGLMDMKVKGMFGRMVPSSMTKKRRVKVRFEKTGSE